MSNDTIEIPVKWWHSALIFAIALGFVLVGASVIYALMFK